MHQDQQIKVLANWVAQFEREANAVRFRSLVSQKKGGAGKRVGKLVDHLYG